MDYIYENRKVQISYIYNDRTRPNYAHPGGKIGSRFQSDFLMIFPDLVLFGSTSFSNLPFLLNGRRFLAMFDLLCDSGSCDRGGSHMVSVIGIGVSTGVGELVLGCIITGGVLYRVDGMAGEGVVEVLGVTGGLFGRLFVF